MKALLILVASLFFLTPSATASRTFEVKREDKKISFRNVCEGEESQAFLEITFIQASEGHWKKIQALEKELFDTFESHGGIYTEEDFRIVEATLQRLAGKLAEINSYNIHIFRPKEKTGMQIPSIKKPIFK